MRLAPAITGTLLAGALALGALPAAAAPAGDLPQVEASELGDASSFLALINPTTQLDPENYTPSGLVTVPGTSVQLRPEASEAVSALVSDARKAGMDIKVLSAYRSYDRQAVLFNQYQAKYGTAYAERISARPGTSEHQLGLAADLGYSNSYQELKEAFGQTEAGQWIAQHAVDYGLIVRYPQGEEETTGYKYEPWHVRYIGKEHAKAMAESGAATFEDYTELLKQQAQSEPAEPEEAEPAAGAENKEQDSEQAGPDAEDLLVLRFLPPYRDWGFGFTE